MARQGGLARLDVGAPPRVERSEEQAVDLYLARHEKVKARVARGGAVEADKLQGEIETRRASEAMTRRTKDRQQSQVARARCGMALVEHGTDDGISSFDEV